MQSELSQRASIPLRVPARIKERAEYAASLRGESLNGFISSILAEASEKIIEDERLIRLSEAGARSLVEVLENPPAPNDKLTRAIAEHKPISRG
jgi:uncharacterized protein (DUF1778 family)